MNTIDQLTRKLQIARQRVADYERAKHQNSRRALDLRCDAFAAWQALETLLRSG